MKIILKYNILLVVCRIENTYCYHSIFIYLDYAKV